MTKISGMIVATALLAGVLAVGCGSSEKAPETAADATSTSADATAAPRLRPNNLRLRLPSAPACEAGTHECPAGEQIACVPDSTAGCPSL